MNLSRGEAITVFLVMFFGGLGAFIFATQNLSLFLIALIGGLGLCCEAFFARRKK